MEARIKQEIDDTPIPEVIELNLDGAVSDKIVGITDKFAALESLSLNNCGITTLKGFPKLPKLKNLELGDNKIQDGLEALSELSNLVFLNLADNPIKSVDILKSLGKLSSLVELDLFSVDISIGKGKREKIFKFIPSLVYLDGCDKDDKPKEECEEEEEDEENGKYDDLEDEEIDEDEELDEEDEDAEEDVSLKDLYNKSLNDTEEGDDDFEGEGEEEDIEDELDEEEEGEEDDAKNLSKESVEEPRKKKQKVSKENGKQAASK